MTGVVFYCMMTLYTSDSWLFHCYLLHSPPYFLESVLHSVLCGLLIGQLNTLIRLVFWYYQFYFLLLSLLFLLEYQPHDWSMLTIINHLTAFWSVVVMNCIQPVNWKYCYRIDRWMIPELHQTHVLHEKFKEWKKLSNDHEKEWYCRVCWLLWRTD